MNQTHLAQVTDAWVKAATELGIVVQPFAVEYDGQTHRAVAYLPHFGGPNGMLLDAADETTQFVGHPILRREADRCGYYYSLLNAESYKDFDRQHFIETLSDWGYFGSERLLWLL
jgi:hypothetical protein